MSLSDYLISEIREIAERPTLAELRARLHTRRRINAELDTARLVREKRDARWSLLDASATIDCLLQTPAGRRIENRIYSHNESLHCPHLLDLEVTQVLRRLVREAVISVSRAQQAIEDLLDLRITRYPHFILLPAIWRHGTTSRRTIQRTLCSLRSLAPL